MSLLASIGKAVSAGFKAAGDVKKQVTITTVVGGVYDPVNDTTSASTATVEELYGFIGSFSEYTVQSSGGKILFSDVKLIVQTLDLEHEITMNSVFTIDGVDYKIAPSVSPNSGVKGIRVVANDVIRIYQLRAM